ncbi:MAG: hypothetical protein M0019_00040 [Actinomycetota bacterium]|nr:hypothetical protein [Actinomycetota bacterium]
MAQTLNHFMDSHPTKGTEVIPFKLNASGMGTLGCVDLGLKVEEVCFY